MRKLILALLFVACLSIQASAFGPMMLLSGTSGEVDLCDSMGASGTYLHWWNGEYSGDLDKACQSSGASTAEGTATAGVIVVGGKINGVYGALLDADDERITWSCPSNTIDEAGTLEFGLTLTADPTSDSELAAIKTDVENWIYITYDDLGAGNDGRIRLSYKGNNNADVTYSDTITDGATVTVSVTWKTSATEALCVDVGNGYDCLGSADLDAFAGTTDTIYVGDSDVGYGSNDLFKIDDFQIREGYEGP